MKIKLRTHACWYHQEMPTRILQARLGSARFTLAVGSFQGKDNARALSDPWNTVPKLHDSSNWCRTLWHYRIGSDSSDHTFSAGLRLKVVLGNLATRIVTTALLLRAVSRMTTASGWSCHKWHINFGSTIKNMPLFQRYAELIRTMKSKVGRYSPIHIG